MVAVLEAFAFELVVIPAARSGEPAVATPNEAASASASTEKSLPAMRLPSGLCSLAFFVCLGPRGGAEIGRDSSGGT
jgi:hypothetical protein